jgi:excisionase family DNA binding protein
MAAGFDGAAGSAAPDRADRRPLLTENVAAEALNVSVRTLQAWRSRKQGPAFVKLGNSVRYRHADLDDWLARSTQDPRQGGGA